MYRKNKKGQFSKVPYVYKVLEHSEQKPRRYSKKVMLGMFLAIAPWMIAGEAYVSLAGVSDKIYLVNKRPIVQAEAMPDPCGLVEVVCDGENVEAKPVALSEIERRIHETFPSNPHKAVAIAKCESGLDPFKPSDSDKMADGRPFSIGLFQINLTVTQVAGLECNKAFQGKNYQAVVVNESLYKQCVKAAENVEHNLEAAKRKQKGNWGAWAWCDTKTQNI